MIKLDLNEKMNSIAMNGKTSQLSLEYGKTKSEVSGTWGGKLFFT